jgi:hypothetical protein
MPACKSVAFITFTVLFVAALATFITSLFLTKTKMETNTMKYTVDTVAVFNASNPDNSTAINSTNYDNFGTVPGAYSAT